MPKKRITLRIDDDEVAVVGSLDKWQHLILLYETLADEFPQDKASWLEAADWIRLWLSKADASTADDGWN